MTEKYENQMSVSVSKVSLEHSHVRSFACCLWLLSPWDGRGGE